MNRKTLNILIPMLSLVIFFVWGWIEGSFKHSWIILLDHLHGVRHGLRHSPDPRQEQGERENGQGRMTARRGVFLIAPRPYNFTLRW